MRSRFSAIYRVILMLGVLPPAVFGGSVPAGGNGDPAMTDALLELKRNRLTEWSGQIAVLQKRANTIAAREKTLKRQIADARRQLEALKSRDRNSTGKAPAGQKRPNPSEPGTLEAHANQPSLADRLSSASAEWSTFAGSLGPARPLGSTLPAALGYAALEAAGLLRNRNGETTSSQKSGEMKRTAKPPPPDSETNPAAVGKVQERIKQLTRELETMAANRKALLVQVNRLVGLRRSVQKDVARLEARRKATQQTIPAAPMDPKPDPPPEGNSGSPKPLQTPTARKNIEKGTGLDVMVTEGTEIHAVETGRVVYADRFEGYGKLVIVEHPDGALSLYGFLSEILVQSGRPIARGQRVGRSGFIEDRDRPGLRFEVRMLGTGGTGIIDPNSWLPEGVDFRHRLLKSDG